MVIVLGGSGYVGGAFMRALSSHGIESQSLSREKIDYTNLQALSVFLKKERPDFLINCAGYTGKPNVDACEDHRYEALLGNAVLPGIVQQACREAGIPWAQISSGCIFSGVKSGTTPADIKGFSVDDIPNFCFGKGGSFYSGTKALGEETLGWGVLDGKWVHKSTPDCYVFRLRIPFSSEANPRNYLTKILSYKRLLDARNSITHLEEFASEAIHCWQKKLPFGIYHLTNPGHITTREITEMMGKIGAPAIFRREYSFFESEKEFMSLAAKTPRSNCVLDTALSERVGLKMTPIQEALEKAIREYA